LHSLDEIDKIEKRATEAASAAHKNGFHILDCIGHALDNENITETHPLRKTLFNSICSTLGTRGAAVRNSKKKPTSPVTMDKLIDLAIRIYEGNHRNTRAARAVGFQPGLNDLILGNAVHSAMSAAEVPQDERGNLFDHVKREAGIILRAKKFAQLSLLE
jgi:hypothetical protein